MYHLYPSLPPGHSPLMWGVVFLHPALWAGFLPVQHPNQHSFGTKSSRWRPSCTSQEQGQHFCSHHTSGSPVLKICTVYIFQISKKIDPAKPSLNMSWTWMAFISFSMCVLVSSRIAEDSVDLWFHRQNPRKKNAALECHLDLIKPSATSLHIFTFSRFDIYWWLLINNLRLKIYLFVISCHLVSSDHLHYPPIRKDCRSQGSMQKSRGTPTSLRPKFLWPRDGGRGLLRVKLLDAFDTSAIDGNML